MIKRAEDAGHKSYPFVGARGIRICSEWRNNFRAFEEWALSNGYEQGLYIDREDNDKGYSPDNCRFITPEHSACNRRSNVYITAWGETKLQKEWLLDTRCTVNHSVLKRELAKGVSPEVAMTYHAPIGKVGPLVTAWGETKRIVEWTKDPRCKADRFQIRTRINAGIEPELAIGTGKLPRAKCNSTR
jgi:hypothetical protein